MESEDETAMFLAATAKASTKTPKANLYENCLSCGNTVSGNFCQTCGQKVDDMRRSLFSLIAETLGGIFSFESRMWRTFGALLFKPGKVAREYADGARMRYSAPIRTYLVVSILFFSFMSITNTHFLSFDVLPKDNVQSTDTGDVPQTDKTGSSGMDAPSIPKQNEEIEKAEKKKNVSFSLDLPEDQTNVISIGGRKIKIRFFTKDSDLHKLTGEELQALTNQVNNEMNIQIMYEDIDPNKLINTLFSNPKQFNTTFNTWLPRMMFLMVPFAMLLGWLFIRGPKALLIDHLIHAIYLQSTLFITTLGTLILSQLISGDKLVKILFLVLIMYFSLSIKRMFGRGWLKTIWTTLVGGFLYSFILLLLMTVITLAAIAKIATIG